jgi:hypothetical protein
MNPNAAMSCFATIFRAVYQGTTRQRASNGLLDVAGLDGGNRRSGKQRLPPRAKYLGCRT